MFTVDAVVQRWEDGSPARTDGREDRLEGSKLAAGRLAGVCLHFEERSNTLKLPWGLVAAMQVRWTLLFATVLVAAPAAAQQASFSLTQEGAPGEVEVTAGEGVELTVVQNLTGEGFTCTSEVIAPVNATVDVSLPSDAPANASVTPTNATKEFPIPANTYETQAYNQQANATVSADTDGGVRENYTATLTVESTFPGGNYSACVPMQFSPASSDPAEVTLSVVADNPPEDTGDDDTDDGDAGTGGNNSTNNLTDDPDDTTEPPANDSGNDTGDGDDEASGVPVPWQAAPVALAAAAIAVRSRGA